MKLKIYNTSNTKAKPYCNEEWAITINRVGIFHLSSGLGKGLSIDAGSYALLAQDENRCWYVTFCDDLHGFMVRIENKKQKYPSKVFSNKTIAERICDEVGAAVSAKFLVSHRAVRVDGLNYYQILTKRPLRK